jgi:hypothetical protein
MNPWILGTLVGLAFGAGLYLSDLANPDKIIGTLRLKDFHAMRVIGVFVLSAIAGVWLLDLAGLANYSVKPAAWLAVGLGGALVGAGFGMTGYCPGTGWPRRPAAESTRCLRCWACSPARRFTSRRIPGLAGRSCRFREPGQCDAAGSDADSAGGVGAGAGRRRRGAAVVHARRRSGPSGDRRKAGGGRLRRRSDLAPQAR